MFQRGVTLFLTMAQIAIAKFFDGEGPDLVAEALAAQNNTPARTTRQENLQESLLNNPRLNHPRHANAPDIAPRIVPQPEGQAIRRPPFLLGLIFTPFSWMFTILSTTYSFFSYLFPFLPRGLRPNPVTGTTRRSNTTGRRSLKPRDAAARLKREVEEEYGENTLPFHEEGYAQALDLAKRDLKFLLIILTSPEHDDTSSWIRDTLLSSEVQSFLNNPANEIVLWVGDVRDSEAYQVSTALRCNKFPFTALVAHTPQTSASAMSVLTRLPGPMSAATYIAQLQTAITSHSEQLKTVRETRNAQNFERTMRQEQDSAYERSLAQDRERARLKKEAEAAAAEEKRREAEASEAAAQLEAKRKQWIQWRANRVSPEPPATDKEIVRIALKLPEAARVMRRFRADATMEEIYAFVECYDLLKDGDFVQDVSKPDGYTHRFDFRLVSTLPRIVYEADESGSIGDKVGRSGNLIVESILEEEEDED